MRFYRNFAFIFHFALKLAMFCVKIFAVASVLLLVLGTAKSQYKNPRGFLELEEKADYKDLIIKKLLMKLNDMLRERRQHEALQHMPPRSAIPQHLLPPHLQPKTLIPQGIPQQLPPTQIIPTQCIHQLPPAHIQQLPPPPIHQLRPIHPPQQVKHAQPYGGKPEPPQHYQPPNGCQYEYEEVPCPCGTRFEECPCQCCQDVQYEEVPCPCCEQQQQQQQQQQSYHEDPFSPSVPAGNPRQQPRLIQTGPVFTETFVSPSENDRTESESPESEQSSNCCMSQGPITHLQPQRCLSCTQQPQMKAHPQQSQQQASQQVLMVPGRPPMLPPSLHPSFFTGFTSDDQSGEERIVQKAPFLHPKMNELLHASHGDTC